MAKYKLPGLRKWIDTISEETARAGAAEIVRELKEKGPYFSGHFEESWVVVGGDKSIPADSPNPLSQAEQWEAWERGDLPLNRRVTPVPIPEGHTQFTIANRADYRNIALDLEPGRVAPGRNNTAPQDWYRTFVEGGAMAKALERGTGIASRNPKVRGFKSSRTIRR